MAELEAGRVPSVHPWGLSGMRAPLAIPKNAATGRACSGIRRASRQRPALASSKMTQKSGPAKEPADQVIKDTRRATRRHFSAEDKIRIALESLRGEASIAEFCRRGQQRRRNETAVMGSTGICGIGVWPSGRNTSGGMEASHIGHSAFEEYRAQTLQRLDQEQREFQEFIARLRAAKDKEEFEQFITDRRMRPPSSQA